MARLWLTLKPPHPAQGPQADREETIWPMKPNPWTVWTFPGEVCQPPPRPPSPQKGASKSPRDDAEGQQGKKQRQSSPTASTAARGGRQGPARARSLIPASVWVLGRLPYRTDGLMAAPLTVRPGTCVCNLQNRQTLETERWPAGASSWGRRGSALMGTGFPGMRERSGTREC